MNKNDIINELVKQTGYDEEKCNLINSIVEDTCIIGNKNKQKMIEKFIEQLKCDENEANKIYEIVMSIICGGIIDKLKHPFRNND